MGGNGSIRIVLSDNPGKVFVDIRDEGKGIPKNCIKRFLSRDIPQNREGGVWGFPWPGELWKIITVEKFSCFSRSQRREPLSVSY